MADTRQIQDVECDDLDRVDCDRCGGDGIVEYFDAPETWGEDCPAEVNHLVECPECRGAGVRP